MLILSRKGGESVAVGDRDNRDHLLKVTVLGISRARVKLGFEAASDVAVHRWEIWQRLQDENDDQSQPATDAREPEGQWDGDAGL